MSDWLTNLFNASESDIYYYICTLRKFKQCFNVTTFFIKFPNNSVRSNHCFSSLSRLIKSMCRRDKSSVFVYSKPKFYHAYICCSVRSNNSSIKAKTRKQFILNETLNISSKPNDLAMVMRPPHQSLASRMPTSGSARARTPGRSAARQIVRTASATPGASPSHPTSGAGAGTPDVVFPKSVPNSARVRHIESTYYSDVKSILEQELVYGDFECASRRGNSLIAVNRRCYCFRNRYLI